MQIALSESRRSNRPSPSSPGAASARSPWRSVLIAAALLLATFVAYLPSLRNGYIWDDDDYVTHNTALRSVDGLGRIWLDPTSLPYPAGKQYYALVYTSFWLEYRLWGLSPVGYHAVNTLLHGLGAVLLWQVLRRLRVPGALLAAAIFALHPVHVESVAWITERKNVLSGVFYFASALAYLRYAFPEETTRRKLAYGVALLLFLFALLSKTVTCSLPAAILVIIWWKRGRISLRDVLPLLPFFALGLSLGLLTAFFEKERVGAKGSDWDFTLVERFLIAGRALWFYAGKLLFPVRLTFIYPRWTIDQSMLWLYLYPIAAMGVIGTLYALRQRIGRGPLAAVLLFAGTLFPALGFFNVYPMRYSFVADHFQYHASAALIALAAGVLTLAVRPLAPASRGVFQASAGALLVIYASLTWQQTKNYRDYATIWEDTLSKNPNSPIALTSVASVRVSQQRVDEAMDLYHRTLKLAPEDDVANFNLGKLYAEQDRNDEALLHLKASIDASPDCGHCHYFYAVVLSKLGRMEQSVPHYEKALEIGPPDGYNYYNYGVTLERLGREEEAERRYHEAIRIQPDLGIAWTGLRDLLLRQSRAPEAEKQFAELLGKYPAVPEGHISQGDIIMSQQNLARIPEAEKHFREALRLRPDWEDATGRLQALEQMKAAQTAAP